jgi:glucokinase
MAKRGWIGIDIGGTKSRFALFDQHFKVVKNIKLKTQDSRSAEEFTDILNQSLAALLKKAEKAGLPIGGVGVGCAGSVNADGSIKDSPNIPFLKGYSFGPVIAKQTGANVIVMNDVAAGLYGEHQLGAAVGRRHVIAIFIGTGIGGALILDGKLYFGANGTAGDIGHYVLRSVPTSIESKDFEILDDVASRTAITAEAGTHAGSSALAKAIAGGNQRIEKLVRTRCRILGIALSNVVDFLNPEMIVLGGGFTDAMPAIVRSEVISGIWPNSKRASKRDLEVVVAKLKGHAGTAGAAKFAADRIQFQ